ncbi:MAG TPA: outer membrane beta-barrel protein, partial [Bacteroidia bacterium]|nr:outer membrane beta-barrel protein [Bacteroidia bacterium]
TTHPVNLAGKETSVSVPSNAQVSPVAGADSLKQKNGQDSVLHPNVSPPSKPIPADSAKPSPSDSRTSFFVSGYYSPELYRNSIHSNTGVQAVKNEMTNPRGSGGLHFGICFPDKLEVSMGCSLSMTNQELHSQPISFPKNITQPFVFNSSLGDMAVPASTMLSSFSPLAPVTNFRFNYQYSQNVQYVNIPLSIGYHVPRGRFTASVSAGINIQYLLSQHSTLELLKENERDVLTYDDLDIRKLNYGLCLGLGAEYSIRKRLSVYLSPSCRYNLLSVTNHSAVQSSALFLGAEGGVRLHF